MNPHTANPYMFILKADPARYIQTPSAAVVALIKAAEGGIAILWLFRLIDYMKQLFSGKAGALPLEIFGTLLPKEIVKLIIPGTIPDGGVMGKVLCWVVAVTISVILICLAVEAVAAYNPNKPQFHPKKNNWVGYVVTIGGCRYYICGDMDITAEGSAVSCDVVLVPCGGTYTMNVEEAAELVGRLSPKIAIPTHYGDIVGDISCG